MLRSGSMLVCAKFLNDIVALGTENLSSAWTAPIQIIVCLIILVVQVRKIGLFKLSTYMLTFLFIDGTFSSRRFWNIFPPRTYSTTNYGASDPSAEEVHKVYRATSRSHNGSAELNEDC